MTKKLLAMLLAALMLCSLLPVGVAADGESHPVRVGVNAYGWDANEEKYEVTSGEVTAYCSCSEGADETHAHSVRLGDLYNDYFANTLEKLGATAETIEYYYLNKNSESKVYQSFDSSCSDTVTLEYVDDTSYKYFITIYFAKPEPQTNTLTLRYDANGGDNAPAAETKTADSTTQNASFVISSQVPTRENHTFLGWALNAAANADFFLAGGYITISADTTLYAVWQDDTPVAKTYKLNYHANAEGVTGLPTAFTGETTEDSISTKVSDTVPVRTGYHFSNWNTAADGSGTGYAPGDDVVLTGDMDLYAIWTCAHQKDNDNYCTVDDCSHGTDCCPKRPAPTTHSITVNLIGLCYTDESQIGVETPKTIPGDIVTVNCDCAAGEDSRSHTISLASVYPGSYMMGELNRVCPNGAEQVGYQSGLGNIACTKHTPSTTDTTQITVDWATQNTPEGYFVRWYFVEKSAPVTYTVTYTDGVADAEIFEDQVTTGLEAGASTPAFQGEAPSRSGYTFKGWSPEVAATVTADATYVAQWEENSTPVVTYTVTYTDGVADEEVFADLVFDDMTAGSKTPGFMDGRDPSRKGYIFTGWKPAVAETVTGDATYTAQWKKIPAAPSGEEMKKLAGVMLDCVNTKKNHEDKFYDLLDGTYDFGKVTYRENAFHSSVTIKADKYIEKYNDYKSGHELAASNADTCYIPLVYGEDKGWQVDVQSEGKVFASFEIVCKNAASKTSSGGGELDDVPKTGDNSMMVLNGFFAVGTMLAIFAVMLGKKKRA